MSTSLPFCELYYYPFGRVLNVYQLLGHQRSFTPLQAFVCNTQRLQREFARRVRSFQNGPILSLRQIDLPSPPPFYADRIHPGRIQIRRTTYIVGRDYRIIVVVLAPKRSVSVFTSRPVRFFPFRVHTLSSVPSPTTVVPVSSGSTAR